MSAPVAEKIHVETLAINEDSIYSKGGSLFIVAEGLTEEFVPLEVMERDVWTFKNKELRYRHRLPEQDVNALIGHVHDVWIENEKTVFLAEIWGYKESLKTLQTKIKDGEMSISAGYKKTEDKGGKVIGIYGRELSITPSPKCTPEMGCQISTIITNELGEKMTDLDPAIAEFLEKLEKAPIKLAEERGERIIELEATLEAMEQRVSDSNEMIATLQDENETLKSKVEKLEASQVTLKTLALRQEIVTLEGITDEKAIEERLEKLSKYPEELLLDTKETIKRAITHNQKISPGRQAPIFSDTNVQNEGNDLDKLTPEQLALRLNPNFKERIQRNSRGAPPGLNNGDGQVPMIN